MRIFAIGRNYVEHIRELNNERPEEPVILITLDTTRADRMGFLGSKHSLQKYLVDEHRRAGAWKRGGRVDFVPLDLTGAEDRYLGEAVDHQSPDHLYDRQWALLFLGRVLDALRERWKGKGKLELFVALNPYLFSTLHAENTGQLAAQFQLTESSVKQNLHRMKIDFQSLFHREVAETVPSEADIEEEINALRAALT